MEVERCSLTSAIDCAHHADMRGYPLEIRLGQGVYQVSGLTVGFDAANSRGSQVTVSALRIVATQPGNIIERIPATSTEPVLTINSGIAPITLEGLGLRGGVDINSVGDSPYLIHSIVNCHFNGNGRAVRPEGGALLVRSGRVAVSNSTFSNLHATSGGALALIANVSAGHHADVNVSDSTFRSNRATQGGAAFVDGGKLTLRASLAEANEAAQEGGALFVDRGEAIMGSGTRIMGNRASRGRAYYLAYGSEADMIYALPAPLAHWVPYPFQCVRYQAPCPRSNPSCSAPDLPDDQQPWNRTRYPELHSQYVAAMTKGPSDDDFPFPCAPGKWSDSTTVRS